MEKQRPKVGVDVIIRKGDEIILHERKDPADNSKWVWHVPGGHLELFEEVADCAKRETLEEVGVTIKDEKIAKVLNNIYPDRHYVTFYVESNFDKGEARVMEPEKCRSVKWFKVSDLPENLFGSLQKLVDTNYFK